MAQGRRSRSTSLHVLLLALMVQGITPDCHDLSSLRLFLIPCLVPAEPDGAVKPGGSRGCDLVAQESDSSDFGLTVTSDDAGEPTLDDVCESASMEMCRILLKGSTVLRHLGAPGLGLTSRPDPTDMSRLCGGSVHDDRGLARIDFLCRLTC